MYTVRVSTKKVATRSPTRLISYSFDIIVYMRTLVHMNSVVRLMMVKANSEEHIYRVV